MVLRRVRVRPVRASAPRIRTWLRGPGVGRAPRLRGSSAALDPRRHKSDDAGRCPLTVASAPVPASTCTPYRSHCSHTDSRCGRGNAGGLCGCPSGRTLRCLNLSGRCWETTGHRPQRRLRSCAPAPAALTGACLPRAALGAPARWPRPWAGWRAPARAVRTDPAVPLLRVSQTASGLRGPRSAAMRPAAFRPAISSRFRTVHAVNNGTKFGPQSARWSRPDRVLAAVRAPRMSGALGALVAPTRTASHHPPPPDLR